MTHDIRFKVRKSGIMAATAAMMLSCQEEKPEVNSLESPPVAPGKATLAPPDTGDAGEPLFESIPSSKSGIALVNSLRPEHPLARLYFSGFACGAVTMGDFNGDGRIDLFFTRGAETNALFLQKETAWEFQDISAEAGIQGGDAWA